MNKGNASKEYVWEFITCNHQEWDVCSDVILPLLYQVSSAPKIALWKCSHTIEHHRHEYHTSVLFNELCNFVLAQEAQKISAKVEM